MNSDGYSYERCVRIVSALDMNRSIEEQFGKYLSSHDLNQLLFSCRTEVDSENSDSFRKPMVWIGIYIALASFFCILAKAADLLYGFGDKKLWFPCKYFSRNGTYITVISVTVKLPVDLSSAMPSYTDQAAKLGSLAFMCTMMANITPSLVSMDNDTLLATVIGTQLQSFQPSRYTGNARLCGLSLSKYCPGDKELEGPPDTRENIDDKEGTNDLQRWFYIGGVTGFITGFWMVCIALLVNRRGRHVFFHFMDGLENWVYVNIMVIAVTVKLPVDLSSAMPSYTDQASKLGSLAFMCTMMANITPSLASMDNDTLLATVIVEKLRQHVRRYWVMAETGSPQFVMASSPLSAASGLIRVTSLLMNLFLVLLFTLGGNWMHIADRSPYKWSTTISFITQSGGVVVGTIAPVFRCFSAIYILKISF